MTDTDWQQRFSEYFSPITPVTKSEEEQIEDIFKLSQEKSKKYDRQLRLWGPHGQHKIDKCSVLLLNASAVGCEVLKNLILPGIGQVTVCDERKVTAKDLGVNFYLRKEDLGKDIASCTAEVLLEMNPDVEGNFLLGSPKRLVELAPDAFQDYDFIIASQMDFETLRKLCKICQDKSREDKKIVLIAVGSYGMVGYMRVFGHDHVITESKLDNPVEDMRLYDSWGDLQKFADLQVLDEMNDKDHAHTPYPVILLQVVKQWKSTHGGKLPDGENDAEKEAFKDEIKKLSRKWGAQENFQEAYDKSYQAYRFLEIPDEVIELMKSPKAQFENIDTETPLFWILMHGLSMFYFNEGKEKLLPLPGRVTDMHSDTARFVRLQSLYRRKHRADVDIVAKYIKILCEKKELIEPTSAEISFFCKYGYNLRCIDYRTIEQELNYETFKKDDLEIAFMEKSSAAMFYCCMRAGDLFYQKFGKYPGEKMDDDVQKEANELYEILKDLITNKFNLNLEFSQFNDDDFKKYAACWTRFGASEIHTISSLVGGVASQELIKLCTQQRMCINNTWVYNGIDSTSTHFEM